MPVKVPTTLILALMADFEFQKEEDGSYTPIWHPIDIRRCNHNSAIEQICQGLTFESDKERAEYAATRVLESLSLEKKDYIATAERGTLSCDFNYADDLKRFGPYITIYTPAELVAREAELNRIAGVVTRGDADRIMPHSK